MKPGSWLLLALALLGACIVFRPFLEHDPVTHVLVLLPALAAAGWMMAAGFESRSWQLDESSANALTLLSVFAILFWMLPRYIDASLTNPLVEVAKFVSIPLCVGAVLALAWRSAHPFLRGFLKANALSMLGVLAFLYTHAPVRICNSYLVSDQERLGFGFLIVALFLTVAWGIPLFFPSDNKVPSRNPFPRSGTT